ncbi:hypothetical protein N7468_008819 [Penicillium chermesinum]|uniref:Bacteriophage T5 Orf172 DNA-binding domain-containing protein n=1 Tax=Penicillium chermesinum TaxID=63820 RepID=A0A9W9NGL0_9EURO|nr:uncharacterized protein N7468_008819 [Penicillium chermesinum]KAJ5219615.1 hypothetical protein N7468_008819 [Penicillium chermesinum]KAJ6153626.1 hypothetical protein N7470_006585 [Penicillium chermesinum]
MATLKSTTPRTVQPRLLDCASSERDESKQVAIISKRPPLSNLPVNNHIRKVDPPLSEKHENSAGQELARTLRGGASQNKPKLGTCGFKVRDHTGSSSNCTISVLTEKKRNGKGISPFSKANTCPTAPKATSEPIFKLCTDEKTLYLNRTGLSLLLNSGVVDTQFDHPSTVFPARTSTGGSPGRPTRLGQPPKPLPAISNHASSVSQTEKAKEKSSSETDQSFFLQLTGTIQGGNKDALRESYDRSLLPTNDTKQVYLGKSLLKVIPPGIISHFLQNNTTCLSLLPEGRRCRIGHATRCSLAQIQSIMSFSTGTFMENIQQLVQLSFCAVHRKVALREIQNWEEELQELTKMHELKSTALPQNKRLQAIIRWMCLLHQSAGTEIPEDTQLLPVEVENIALPINPIQQLQPYKPQRLKGSVNEELKKLLTKPLPNADVERRGSIYIFWQRPNFGHLKIGRTNNVRGRLEEWNKQCKKELMGLFPDLSKESNESSPDFQKLRHIGRIEALVHTELMNYRRCEPKCPGCDKKHIEWFETSQDHAVRVVRKWNAWMATEPYEKHIVDDKEEWILKSEEEARIDQLCQPELPSPSSSPPSRRDKGPRRARHSLPGTRNSPPRKEIRRISI